MSRDPAVDRSFGSMAARLEAPLAAALGALQTWAFVETSLWWLPPLALALLVWRLDRATPRRAAWLAWLYGTAWLAAGTWWLFISMHRYGGLPAPLAALAVLMLAAALSLYLALAAAAYSRWRSGRVAGDALLFAALWLAAELARGVVFTGFPWVASGYAWVDAPLALLAPWIGVYGMGAVLAFIAAAAAKLPAMRRAPGALLGAALVAVLLLPGLFGPVSFTRSAGSISVTLLQSNVAQDDKFADDKLPGVLGWSVQSLLAARGQLVLSPETLIPLLPSQLETVTPDLWTGLREHFSRHAQAALIGTPLGDFEAGYTNSVVGLSRGSEYRYDKHHLVPFGEFIPLGFRWFTSMMNIPLGDFARGPVDAPSFGFAGQRIAPNICYEDLFGEELALRFRSDEAAPTMLANVSNIAWFGDTIALPQHLNISRLRALELQRPMLRATNTGATAAIDHRGRVTAQLPPFTRGALDAIVEGRVGLTPYASWAGRAGLWPLVVLSALKIGLAAFSVRRRGVQNSAQR